MAYLGPRKDSTLDPLVLYSVYETVRIIGCWHFWGSIFGCVRNGWNPPRRSHETEFSGMVVNRWAQVSFTSRHFWCFPHWFHGIIIDLAHKCRNLRIVVCPRFSNSFRSFSLIKLLCNRKIVL